MKKKEFSLSVFFLEIFFTWPTTKTCQAIPAAIRWKTGSVFSVPAGLCVFCLGYPVRAYVLQIEQSGYSLAAVRTYHEIGGIRMSIADCMGSLLSVFLFSLRYRASTGAVSVFGVGTMYKWRPSMTAGGAIPDFVYLSLCRNQQKK